MQIYIFFMVDPFFGSLGRIKLLFKQAVAFNMLDEGYESSKFLSVAT